jgi:hypothetical protein
LDFIEALLAAESAAVGLAAILAADKVQMALVIGAVGVIFRWLTTLLTCPNYHMLWRLSVKAHDDPLVKHV